MPRLDISNYYLEELLVRSNSAFDFDAESQGVEPAINFDFFRNDASEPRFLVRLTVDLGEESGRSLPYQIHLAVFAAFDATNDSNNTLIEQLVATNAAPILYGIARGIIGQATAQAIHGPYVLPTVNFIELAKKKVQATTQTAELDAG